MRLFVFCVIRDFGVLSRLAGQAVPKPLARLFRPRLAGLPLVAVELEKSREKSPLSGMTISASKVQYSIQVY